MFYWKVSHREAVKRTRKTLSDVKKEFIQKGWNKCVYKEQSNFQNRVD